MPGGTLPSDPPEPADVKKRIVAEEESRKREELRKQQESPDSFTSYQGKVPGTHKEIMALFRKCRRVVALGQDAEIVNIRSTKTRGVIIDFQFKPDGD